MWTTLIGWLKAEDLLDENIKLCEELSYTSVTSSRTPGLSAQSDNYLNGVWLEMAPSLSLTCLLIGWSFRQSQLRQTVREKVQIFWMGSGGQSRWSVCVLTTSLFLQARNAEKAMWVLTIIINHQSKTNRSVSCWSTNRSISQLTCWCSRSFTGLIDWSWAFTGSTGSTVMLCCL